MLGSPPTLAAIGPVRKAPGVAELAALTNGRKAAVGF
jgi:hypothetical protein